MALLTDLSQPITSLSGLPATRDDTSLAPQNSQSYLRGSDNPSLSRDTVWQQLERTARKFAARDAAVFCESGARWSWSELLRRVDDVAAGLLAVGLARGDRLAIWSPNDEAWLLTQFATARIGVVLVTVNPAIRSGELSYVLNKAGAAALIVAPEFRGSRYLDMIRELAPELANCAAGNLLSARLPDLKTIIQTGSNPVAGCLGFDQLTSMGGPAHRQRLSGLCEALDPDDPINIQFTSGTTGSPKGATLTHYNIVNNARFTVQRMAFDERDRLCIPVPLYHCFGMVMGTLGCASTGSCMVFPGRGFDAAQTLTAVERERCTAIYGVPTMFVAMLDRIREQGSNSTAMASLRTGIMAGAPCPIEVMQQVVDSMNLREITIAYGMTETSPVSFQSHTTDPLDLRTSTVGRIQPHTEVKLIDEQGQIVPVGQQGELCTRGYLVMLGYYRDEAQTRAAIDAAGWMHSGDLAVFDAQGYCSIVGRLGDMIIRAGENVYPREIEEVLFKHPDVQQAQVFGIPDTRLGEAVCAWVVLESGAAVTEKQLNDYCREHLAGFKVPEYFRFKAELPMTATGKPRKFVMRDQMIGELQQQ